MLKKLLFFFLVIISFRNSFSQKKISISIQGNILNSDNKEKLFGSSLYFMQKDLFFSRSVSESNGSFLLTAKIAKSDVYELIVSKKGFLIKKILIDLSSLDFSSLKNNTLSLKKDFNISLFPIASYLNIKMSDSLYSEKYSWNQQVFQLIEDKSYSLNYKDKLKNSNLPENKIVLDSSEIKLQDKIILDKVSVITQQAKLLAKEKKFKSSVEKYSEAELLLMKLLNTNSKNRYLSELGTEKIKTLERKNSEDQVFKIQLLKATENYNLGRKGYAKAKIILMTDPMQSRVNEPEVIALKDNINKMEAYFVLKDAAYRLVNSKKKNAEAIISLLKTQEFAFLSPKIVPVNEFSQLEKSIDSLQFVINPKIIIEKTPIVSPASTQNQGTILFAPGEIHIGKDSDAYLEIIENIEKDKNASIYKMAANKNDLDYELHFKNTLQASINQDAQLEIIKKNNIIDSIAAVEKKLSVERQYQIQEKILSLDREINERDLRVKAENTLSIEEIADKKNQLDIAQKLEKDQEKERLENELVLIQNNKDRIILKEIEIRDKEKVRLATFQKNINSLEYALYKKDSISKVESEVRLNTIQKSKDFQKSYETSPNYLKNEAGILYEKNKMTEVIYKIKNSEGFVTTIVLRRVVVDENGYGVVYEQTTNENGKSFFTQNGQRITETIWFNQSTGINVIKK